MSVESVNLVDEMVVMSLLDTILSPQLAIELLSLFSPTFPTILQYPHTRTSFCY